MARLAFAVSALRRLAAGQPRDCPHCASCNTVLLQRKKLFLELRRCQNCFLKYRYPKDDAQTNVDFYQNDYQEGMTTAVPSLTELSRLLETNFRGSAKDLSANISIIRRHKSGGHLLDYGCSWGYGVHQFRQMGYDAVGFEISRPRARYGREYLKVEIIDSFSGLDTLSPRSFDVIHCSHVLEHLPELERTFTTFRRLLKPQGVLAIFVPNAGGKLATELGVRWGPMIGEKHCLALDAAFFAHNLPKFGFEPLLGSSPYDLPLVAYESEEQMATVLSGDELLVLAHGAGTGKTVPRQAALASV